MKYNLLKSDYIYIQGEIDRSTTAYVEALLSLMKDNPNLPVIGVRINSEGGRVDELKKIHQLFRKCKKPVCTFTLGRDIANSAAAFLLSSGTPGYRFACPKSNYGLHYVTTQDVNRLKLTKTNRTYTVWYFNKLDKFSKAPKGTWLKFIQSKEDKVFRCKGGFIKAHGLIDHLGYPIIEV